MYTSISLPKKTIANMSFLSVVIAKRYVWYCAYLLCSLLCHDGIKKSFCKILEVIIDMASRYSVTLRECAEELGSTCTISTSAILNIDSSRWDMNSGLRVLIRSEIISKSSAHSSWRKTIFCVKCQKWQWNNYL